MKRVLLLFIAIAFSMNGFSQWQSVISGTTSNLVDICFVNDAVGFIVGDDGTVLKTVDQGNNWSTIANLSGNFTSICNVGIDTIFAGGNNIYRSNNGGNAWSNIITLPFTLSDLLFFNSQKGLYIANAPYTCSSSQGTTTVHNYSRFNTNDSGQSWQFSFSGLQSWSRFELLNDSSAFITGAYYSIFDHCNGYYSSMGWKTTDLGTTWINKYIPGCEPAFFSLINDTLGYFYSGWCPAATPPALWKMTDSSFTFSSFTMVLDMSSFNVKQLVFINELNGYLLNGNDIYRTITGGTVWTLDFIPSSTLNKLYNHNNEVMFAIGTNGTILKSPISVLTVISSIHLFPNPATSELRIENAELRIEGVEIYNVLGERVYSQQETSNQQPVTVNVSQLLRGVYFVAVTDDKGNKITRKFIKI